MKYALLLYADPAAGPDPESPEMADEMQRWFQFGSDLIGESKILGGEALHATEAATTVKKRNDKLITADGPFAETKEALGGFYLIEAKDIDDAITIASDIPNIHYGTVEIRPIMDFSDMQD